jgi:hypothetical protein
MKLNYTFLFAAPLALVFFLDQLFIELLAPKNYDLQGTIISMISKPIAGFAFLYSAYYFTRMSPFMRFAFVISTFYIIGLSLESYYKYNTFFVYPHVFFKVLIFYYSFFVYTFYKGNYKLNYAHIVWFIVVSFWANVLIVNPDSLSLAAFTDHNRGVYSTSVYMLIIPFLYFLTNYFFKGGMLNLFMSFFMLLCIFFFQHRTVWVSTSIVLVIYYLLFRFKTNTPITAARIMPIVGILLVGGIASSALVFSTHPEVVTKILDNFSDIENYDKQGTGSWRYTQFLSYLPFIEENFIMGMRFEGFELPIQFYREDINQPVFEDGYGHFFHSFYVDVLFYVGFLGLSLFLLQAFYAIWKTFRIPVLTDKQIMLISFILSGFVFGLSYIFPPFFYGILGWCIVTLEEDNDQGETSYLMDFVQRRKERLQALKAKLISSN